jgi:hypothetical protein
MDLMEDCIRQMEDWIRQRQKFDEDVAVRNSPPPAGDIQNQVQEIPNHETSTLQFPGSTNAT